MVCEATTGYIGNMEIYTAAKKLEETIFSVLEPYLDLWHHVYKDAITIVLKLQKSYS
jgi:hypothetical protein